MVDDNRKIATVTITTKTCTWCIAGSFLVHKDNDKPAIIHSDGTKAWYIKGKPHRENDQPAVVCSDGSKEWWINGKRHREDNKPAVVHPNGVNEWWVNDKLTRW